MKKIAGPIRVELAQYRDLASFAQFGSELDKTTRDTLAQGERIMEVLKQPQYKPMTVEHQVLILFVVTRKHLMDVKVSLIGRFEEEFLEFIETKYSDIIEAIKQRKEIDDELEKKIDGAVKEFKTIFKND